MNKSEKLYKELYDPATMFSQCDSILKKLTKSVKNNIYEIIADFQKYITVDESRGVYIVKSIHTKDSDHEVMYSSKTTTKWNCDCIHFSHKYFHCCHIYSIMILNVLRWNNNAVMDYLFYRMKNNTY